MRGSLFKSRPQDPFCWFHYIFTHWFVTEQRGVFKTWSHWGFAQITPPTSQIYCSAMIPAAVIAANHTIIAHKGQNMQVRPEIQQKYECHAFMKRHPLRNYQNPLDISQLQTSLGITEKRWLQFTTESQGRGDVRPLAAVHGEGFRWSRRVKEWTPTGTWTACCKMREGCSNRWVMRNKTSQPACFPPCANISALLLVSAYVLHLYVLCVWTIFVCSKFSK